ncbi:MAG: hypothetical protein HW418_4391 [Anaerolineales bacterium]|nr:hypothetical protein [Anaerolineales bacterium]
MTLTLTIEEFNTLLTSDREESPLLKALRELTKIEKPEDRETRGHFDAGWDSCWLVRLGAVILRPHSPDLILCHRSRISVT